MRVLVLIIFTVSCKYSDAECDKNKCVQKCCPDRQYVAVKKCAPLNKDSDIENVPVFNDNLDQMGNLKQYFGIKPSGFDDDDLRKSSLRKLTFYLKENGSALVVLDKKGSNYTFDIEDYCLDYRLVNESSISTNAYIWFRTTSSDKNDQNAFFTYSLLLSSWFLLLVLVVYSLLPELRNLGGLVLMCYVASLMFAYIFLFVVKSSALFRLDGTSCIAMTLFVCFFFLAAFCWMNVMSYDIWWTFRGYAKARPIHRRGERFKFKMYSLYAWSVPLGMTILILVMNSVDDAAAPGVIKPQIPLKGCFIAGSAQLVYFYVPMLIMIICNWVFYLMTAFNIWRLSRGTKVLDSVDSSSSGTASARHNNKQRFVVYLKLSALMGLSWILEVVSSFTPKMTFWVITDAYNIFMGLMIFIIFVCKKKIFRKLKKRFGEPKLGHQVSSSFTTRSRSTTESNPLNMPLKNRESMSHQH